MILHHGFETDTICFLAQNSVLIILAAAKEDCVNQGIVNHSNFAPCDHARVDRLSRLMIRSRKKKTVNLSVS